LASISTDRFSAGKAIDAGRMISQGYWPHRQHRRDRQARKAIPKAAHITPRSRPACLIAALTKSRAREEELGAARILFQKQWTPGLRPQTAIFRQMTLADIDSSFFGENTGRAAFCLVEGNSAGDRGVVASEDCALSTGACSTFPAGPPHPSARSY